jgi:hypothetical protein
MPPKWVQYEKLLDLESTLMKSVTNVFDSVFLSKMRRQALRNGAWYKILDSAERAIINLVPKCMEKPKSKPLIDMLAKIIAKIQNASRSSLVDFINQVGKPMAIRISRIAQKWGNKPAQGWAEDEGFSRYLAIVNMNSFEPRMACGGSG